MDITDENKTAENDNPAEYSDPIEQDYQSEGLFIIYLVDNKTDKEALIERLTDDAEARNLGVVRLNIANEPFKAISGSIKFRIIIKYHPPLWWREEPFLLLVENISKLSPKKAYDVKKLSVLVNYTRIKSYSPLDSLDRTLPKESVSRSVMLTSEHEDCIKIFKEFESPSLLYSVRVYKVYRDETGRWHKNTPASKKDGDRKNTL